MIPCVPLPLRTTLGPSVPLRLASHAGITSDSAELRDITSRFIDDVRRDCGLELSPAGPEGDAIVRVSIDPTLEVAAAPPRGMSPDGCDPAEGAHRITIDHDEITIAAVAREGAFRGLTTLRQLIAAGMGPDGSARLDAMVIEDAPRFAWRGLSLDVVRTFLGVDEVREVIDVLALHKLNVLHLHLTDDQGWRLEIPGWPELTRSGAAGAMGDRPGGHYARKDLEDLIAYAAERFITVIPEVDMPGHCAAAIRSHPELASERGTNLLDPDHPGVLGFAADVIRTLAEVAPGGFVHLGGDEAFGMDPGAYQRFVDAARTMALEAGLQPIFWQEAARSTIGPSDVVQYWLALDPSIEELLSDEGRVAQIGSAAVDLGMPAEMLPVVAEMFRSSKGDLARAVEHEARVIVSPASHVYLDRPYAEPPVDPSQADLQRRLGLKVYPRQSVEESFAWDPMSNLAEHPHLIAGIEAAIWCETIATFDELVFMLLPRLAGVAERAWSAPPGASWAEYRTRLGAQSRLWEHHGWSFFGSSLVEWTRDGETESSSVRP
jgi:hexosaminidase